MTTNESNQAANGERLKIVLCFLESAGNSILESENFENSTQEKGSLGNEIPESKNLEMEFWKTEVLAMR